MQESISTSDIRYAEKTVAGELLFARKNPGFFTTVWYPLIWIFLIVSLGFGDWGATLLALVGLYKNGYSYPRRYGVYAPGYFWFSLFLAAVPLIMMVLSLPVR